MNLTLVKNAITSKAGRQVLLAQKNSPTLLFGAGIVGVVATAVLASRATLRLDEVLDKAQQDKETADNLVKHHKDYSKTDHKKDLAYIRVRTATSICKLYGPAVIVGGLSVAALTGSHVVLTRRNAAVTAAYAAVEKGFSEYRKRVIDELGPEKDREFRYGTEIVEEKVVGKNGETKTEKKVRAAGKHSIYARIFDSNNRNWNPSPEYNLAFLRCQQNYLNDRLQSRGHVMLNDAYDALGLERSSEGTVVGWLKGQGDNYVDFGVWSDRNMDSFLEFMSGHEDALLLDFNVDGVIWDKI